MKNKLLTFAFLFTLFLALIPAGGGVSAQKNGRNHGRVQVQGNHNGQWRRKDTHGYKNYGQYRRTQVGNRRYKWERRYYYSGGRRRYRLFRIFY